MKRLTMLIGTIVVSCLVLFGFRKSFETATAGDPQQLSYITGETISIQNLLHNLNKKQVIKSFMKRSIQTKPC